MLKSELNARNKIAAINTLAVPVILYSYGVIWLETGWDTEPWQNDQEATVCEPDASHEGRCRQDIPPMPRRWKITDESGKRIQSHNDRTTDIHDQTRMIVQIKAVLRHQNSKALHSVPKEAEKYLTEAGTTDDMTNDHGKTATWKAKQLKLKYKEDFKKMVRDKWREKAVHGKFPNYLDKDQCGCRTIIRMDEAHWTQRRNWRTHHNSTGSGIEHQILQQTHHQARNHRQMQNVPYPARNCGTHHIRVPNTRSRSVP